MIVRLRLIDGQDPARRLGIGARRSEQHGLSNGGDVKETGRLRVGPNHWL